MPLCPPQTPHAARTRTRAAAVGSQRLTAELRHGLKFILVSCCMSQWREVTGVHIILNSPYTIYEYLADPVN
jgi:hypothetical protein